MPDANQIDWGKLVAQGRAKAIGIPWSEEEAKARALGIPADYVRQGILTLEDYEKAKTKGLTPTPDKETLLKEAKELGIAVTPEATIESLQEVIATAKKKGEKKAKAKATPKKTIKKKK